MKQLLTLGLCTILTCTALAKDVTNTNKISLKVNLTFQQNHDNYKIDSDMQIANDNQWNIVKNNHQVEKGNILLLSKLEKVDSQAATIEFLILNSGQNPSVISKPKIIIAYGQQGKMRINENANNIELNVLATKIK